MTPLVALLALAVAPPPLRLDADGLPLPMHAVARLGTAAFVHGDTIHAVALSRDLRRSATCSSYEIVVWDNATGHEVRRAKYEGGPPPVFEVLGDGTVFVASGEKAEVTVIDGPSGKARALALPVAKPEAAVVSPDGKELFTADGGGTVIMTDAVTGRETARLVPPGPGEVNALRLSPDGKRLAVLFRDRGPAVWDVAMRRMAWEAAAEAFHFITRDACFVGDLVAIADDKNLVFLDARTGKADGKPFDAGRFIMSVAADGDAGKVLYRDMEGTTRRVDVNKRSAAPMVEGVPRSKAVAAGRPGVTAVASGGLLYLVDHRTGRVRPDISQRRQGIVDVRVTGPDTIVALGDGGRATTWDLRTKKAVKVVDMAAKEDPNSPLRLNADGTRAFRTDESGVALEVYDTASGRKLPPVKLAEEGHVQYALSPDGKRVAVRAVHNDLCYFTIRDATTGKIVVTPKTTQDAGWPRLWSPDGRIVVTCPSGGGRGCWLWETTTGELRRRVRSEYLEAHAFRPDGRVLAVGTDEGIRLVSLVGGKDVVLPVSSHSKTVFSPDGKLVATLEDRLRLWRADGTPVATLRGKWTPAFTPDGRTLITPDAGGSLLVWRVPREGEPQEPLPEDKPAPKWADLAGDDADTAISAMVRLGDAALPVIEANLAPLDKASAEKLASLIDGLDADTAAVRRESQAELRRLGERALAALRAAKPKGIDSRRAVARLITAAEGTIPDAAELQAVRAVEVLEHVGTPRARALLRKVAAGGAGPRTREAAAALSRMK